MSKIITVSREFGSGGRELGKRLADELGIAYFDKEILEAIAEKTNTSEWYAKEVLDRGVLPGYTMHFGHSFSSGSRNSIRLRVMRSAGITAEPLLLRSHGVKTIRPVS